MRKVAGATEDAAEGMPGRGRSGGRRSGRAADGVLSIGTVVMGVPGPAPGGHVLDAGARLPAEAAHRGRGRLRHSRAGERRRRPPRPRRERDAGAALPRIHLDLYAGDAEDQAAEVARLVGLGATEVDWDRYPENADFVVLADPEGNRFCIIDTS